MKDLFQIAILIFFILPAFRAVGQPALEPARMEELRRQLIRAAKPTADQEVQLDQILQTHRQAVENWRRQNDETLQAAQRLQADAVQSGDRDTLQAVEKELRELMESRRELLQTMLNQMEDVLDESQFAKAREIILQPAHTGVDVLGMLPHIPLTKIQNEKVQAVLNRAAAQARTKKAPAARDEIMDAAVEDIRQIVLTQPQRDALDKLLRQAREQDRRRAMLRKMEFTDEQKTRMNAILAEARQRAEKAGTPQEKRAILADAHKAVRRDVWTQTQRDQFFLTQVEQQRRRLLSIGMSEAQVAQAEKILAEAHRQARAAGSVEEKRQILRDAFEAVRRNVLRPDQRERLK